jgi:hypothetical protein
MSKRARLTAPPFFDPDVEPEAEPVLASDVRQLRDMFRGLEMPPELKSMMRDATFHTWKHNGVQYLPRDGGWWIAPGQAIGAGAFVGCNRNITFGRNTTIHPSAFHEFPNDPARRVASGVTGVTFHASHTDIPRNMFRGCASLATVEGNGILRVGNEAFHDCIALASVTLPAASEIGGGAFNDCLNLASVTLPAASRIGFGAFYDCLQLASVTLPAASVIEAYAFAKCALVNVDLPKSRTISTKAFGLCEQLVSVNAAAQMIGEGAFLGCNMLVRVELPEVMMIEHKAFSNCPNLAVFECRANATIAGDAFAGSTKMSAVEKTPGCNFNL